MASIDLKNRAFIVTGASRGMGRAMAESLLTSGARIAALSPDTAELNATVEALRKQSGKDRVTAIDADISNPEHCKRAVQECISTFGQVDGLINNAALGQPYLRPGIDDTTVRFWEADPVRWGKMIQVNVIGTFMMANAVTPHLIARKWGRVVNVTTSLGTIQRGGNTPYGPSKGAIEAMTLAWSKELEDTGVTMNSLIPGGVTNTAFVPDAYRAKARHMLEPEVMKAPIVWIMSDQSDGFTGRRFVAKEWDANLPPTEAAQKAIEAPVYLKASVERT
jgi:NAD(P)-dependent dehydrogenase (short-subunit alcohol dehydrogenase family)